MIKGALWDSEPFTAFSIDCNSVPVRHLLRLGQRLDSCDSDLVADRASQVGYCEAGHLPDGVASWLASFRSFLRNGMAASDSRASPHRARMISGVRIERTEIVSPLSRTLPRPAPERENTAVPGMIPKNVVRTNVVSLTPAKAGMTFTRKNGNTGASRSTSK